MLAVCIYSDSGLVEDSDRRPFTARSTDLFDRPVFGSKSQIFPVVFFGVPELIENEIVRVLDVKGQVNLLATIECAGDIEGLSAHFCKGLYSALIQGSFQQDVDSHLSTPGHICLGVDDRAVIANFHRRYPGECVVLSLFELHDSS